MKTHIFFKYIVSFTILLTFSFSLYSQEICNNGIDDDADGLIDMNDVASCNCAPIIIPSMIPNPSFEQTNCCPTTYSQVSCAAGWSQATDATSDYFNCGFNFASATNAGLVPPPDGVAYLGTIFSPGWQEYVGSCLSTPMLAGQSYTLTMNIASAPIDGSGGVCNGGVIDYGAIDITIFGNPACVAFPIGTTGCPPGWPVLASVNYNPLGSWAPITFTFTPTTNINSIIIGSPCALPGSYSPPSGCYPYFYYDNLILTSSSATNLTQTGSFCMNNLQLQTTNNPTSTYQWYYGGVALVGQTAATLQISANNYPSGDYTLVENFSDGTCGSMDINLPPPPTVTANFSTTSQCSGVALNFTDASTISSGTITSWNWNFGDGNTSTLQNPTHTYNADGTYAVQLITADAGQCSDTVVINVTLFPNPTSIISYIFSNSGLNAPSGCLIETIQFADSSTIASPDNIVGWSWDFGDGNTSILQNPSHQFATSGNYTVQLIVTSNNGCKDTSSINLTIYPLPSADFTFTNVCLGTNTPFTDLSNGNGGTINQWNWDFNNDGTVDDITQNPTNGYAGVGSYVAELFVSTSNGCVDSITKTVVVNPNPVANFSATSECLNTTTQFTDSSTVTTGSITTFLWDFGDGVGTSALQSPSYLYTNSGIFNVSLTVTSDSGCSDNIIIPVTVYSNPIANFISDTACLSFANQFTDQSTIGNAALSNWNWDFDNDGIINNITQNPTFIFSGSGLFPVNLNIVDVNGCVHDTTLDVVVSANPLAAFTFSDECFGTATSLTNQSNDNGGTTPIDTWEWDFENNGTVDDVNQNPSNLFPIEGNHTVELLVTSVLGCKDSVTVVVDVDAIPVANFGGTNECLGFVTSFTDSSTTTIGNVNQWDWDFGDTSPIDNNQNPNHQYATSGVFNVTLTVVSDSGCTHTFNTNVEVYDNPIANFSTDTACLSYATSFSDLTTLGNFGIQAWYWDYDGDGLPNDSLQNPTFIFAGAGTFPVNLSVIDTFGCVHDTTLDVIVSDNPSANFTFPNVCFGTTTSFTDLSNANGGNLTNWNWDFTNNGSVDNTTQNPTNGYPAAGSYTVELMVETALGCMDSITKTVTVNPIPVANFSAPDVCLNTTTPFTDLSTVTTGTIQSYFWDFADGSGTDTLQSPNYLYGAVNMYNVSLTVTSDSNCINTIVIPVTVFNNPTAAFTTTDVCQNVTANFNSITSNGNGGIIDQWDWDIDFDGTTHTTDYTSQNPTNYYLIANTYTVELIVTTTDGCSDTVSNPITIFPMPNALYSFSDTCFGIANSFTDNSTVSSGTITNWDWDFGNTNTSTTQNPTQLYAADGQYPVTLIVTTDNFCKDTITQTINVWPLPVVDFTPTSVCLNTSTQFTDLSTVTLGSNVAWTWNFGDATALNLSQNPMHTYATDGTFQAELFVTTNYACKDSLTKTVTVHPNPVVSFLPDSLNGCAGVIANFTDNSTINAPSDPSLFTWNWNFGNGLTSTNQNPQGIVFGNTSNTSVALYTVSLTVTADTLYGSCSTTDSLVNIITVYPKPIADFTFSPQQTDIYDREITFIDNSIIASQWLWNLGDGDSSIVPNPIHEYADSGSYLVTLFIENIEGCKDTVQKIVKIDPVFVIFIPNAFTPAGDNLNDYFSVKGYGITQLEMLIFDRWGEKIWEGHQLDDSWDGTYKGKLVENDVYVYKIKVRDVFKKWHNYIGKVTVIR